jgi:hypothetical protein
MIHNFGAHSNGAFGVWVQASTNTLMDQFQAGDHGANGIAGVYFGCSITGPSPTCASSASSLNLVAHGSQDGNKKYGIAVDTGSNNNVLTNIPDSQNVVNDAFDGNPNCANNLWFANQFGATNQSCVQ